MRNRIRRYTDETYTDKPSRGPLDPAAIAPTRAASNGECCTHCGEPFESPGVWYWERARVCSDCFEELAAMKWWTDLEANEQARTARELRQLHEEFGNFRVAIATAAVMAVLLFVLFLGVQGW